MDKISATACKSVDTETRGIRSKTFLKVDV